MPTHRIYIDESGDHTYREFHAAGDRFLALTAAVFPDEAYRCAVQPRLEELKQRHFRHDPDEPVILTRSQIIKQKGAFGVLREPVRRVAFGDDMVAYATELPAQFFTVVMDKQRHIERYPNTAFDPYVYSIEVLMNRMRGWLNKYGYDAEVIVECRGKREDAQIQAAYTRTLARGTQRASPAELKAVYPVPELRMLRKSQNVAGLQVADLICYGQKQLVLERNALPLAGAFTDYTRRLNSAIDGKVNRYGQYLLQ